MREKLIPPISTYGDLYHAFQHAQDDAEFFKFVFYPDHRTWRTCVIWVLVILFLASSGYSGYANSGWMLAAAVIFLLCFMLMAEQGIVRGVKLAFPANSEAYYLAHNVDKQPREQRRSVIRFIYFIKYLRAHAMCPTLDELEHMLLLIEANNSDRPASTTDFLRHPLVVTLIGIVIYSFNAKIVGAVTNNPDWLRFALILLGVTFLVSIGGLFHAIRYMGPREQWQFQRCLRWYQTHRIARDKPVKADGEDLDRRKAA